MTLANMTCEVCGVPITLENLGKAQNTEKTQSLKCKPCNRPGKKRRNARGWQTLRGV